MNAEHWDRLATLFFGALDRESGEREAFLDAACAGDDVMRAEIEAMLAAHERSQGLLLENRFVTGDPGPLPRPDALIGTRIGAYRLSRLLGEGGMGAVYLAERDDAQYRQAVALKLIRPGLHTADVVSRFRVERQILARLQHPHIARLLDGGMTEAGLPYLVMEYVEGTPITHYCDAHRLPISERLRLFRTVCRAVQFAHRNLVVHRDIKPSNILVTADGQVKLLDFGIAKLLDPTVVPVSLPLTRAGVRLLTPEYAAPEQIRGEAITTATDVYALGVLLYELLTGHRPYRLPERRQAEAERIICEEEPTRPSTVVSEVEQIARADGTTETLTPERIGAARRIAPGRLRRTLQGDLDNIVMMALRKEPERRYASAEQVAEDLTRYLDGRPVIARKDTVAYRVSRFVRRHRVGVAAASFCVLLLAAGVAAVLWQARVAEAERDRARLQAATAEQVSAFLVDLFAAPDPAEALGDTLTAYDLLERGVRRIERDLAAQPLVRATLLNVLGRTYSGMGRFDLAEPLLVKSLAERERLLGASHEDVATSLHDLALLLKEQGAVHEADSVIRLALDVRRARFGEEHPDVAASMNVLAALYHDQGRYEAADSLYRRVLAMRRRLLGDTHHDVATTLNNLAALRFQQDSLDEAATLMREALLIRRNTFGSVHPEVATSLNNLSMVLMRQGKLDEALQLRNEELALQRELMGEDNPFVARSLANLAGLEKLRGNVEVAERIYRQVLEMQRRLLGPDHPDVALILNNLARLLKDEGRYAEAEPLYREALAIWQRHFDAHPQVAMGLNNLGTLLAEQGRYEEAEHLLRRALAMNRTLLGDGHVRVGYTLDNLADVLVKQRDYAGAEPLYREALALFDAAPDLEARTRQHLHEDLVTLYVAWGKPAEAAAYRARLRQASAGMR